MSAEYLDAVASVLEAVANKLESGDDASLETHMLFHLIRGFRSGFGHLVDDEMMSRLDELAKTYYRPSTGSPYGPHPKLKEAKTWIIKARKTAGSLRAKAQLLKTK